VSSLAANAGGQSLEAILTSTPCLWKGALSNRNQATIATGHTRLDSRLPGGGWPRGAVTELITSHPGVGEFSLLFPALATIGEQGRWLILIDPPWVPYPAALHGHGLCLERLLLIRTSGRDESLWACEQALRDIPEGIVLAWPEEIRFATLRRLQLAAQGQNAMAFVFRPETAAATASPAALRLKLNSSPGGMRIEILKCRGHNPAEAVLLHQPQYSQRNIYERTSMVGGTAAAPGAGLSSPRTSRTGRACRRH
jgi:cell division inhibitor SulA/protein ImuA